MTAERSKRLEHLQRCITSSVQALWDKETKIIQLPKEMHVM